MIALFEVVLKSDIKIYDEINLPSDYLFYAKGFLKKKDYDKLSVAPPQNIESAKFIRWKF